MATFTQLTDVPNSYVGQDHRFTRVKADESGLEFVRLLDTWSDGPYSGLILAGLTVDRPAAGKPHRYYWSTDDSILWYDDGTNWRVVSKDAHTHPEITYYSTIVDQDHALAGSANIYTTILAAKDAGYVDILVRNAGDTAALTIAAADAVQRLLGVDADTTTLPVNLTVRKNAVTIEDLFLKGANLTIGDAGADEDTVRECLISGASVFQIGDGTNEAIGHTVEHCRLISVTAIPLVVKAQAALLALYDLYCSAGSGAGYIHFDLGANQTLTRLELRSLRCSSNSLLTDYAVRTSGTGSSRLVFAQIIDPHLFEVNANGGLDLSIEKSLIFGGTIINSVALTAGRRLLRVSSPALFDIASRIQGILLQGFTGTDVLFECASADADAAGLVMVGNTFRNGTVLFSQDSMWLGNDFDGCTLNFQSKIGIHLKGGSARNVTLQNIPADITIEGVAGQDNRGMAALLKPTVKVALTRYVVPGWTSQSSGTKLYAAGEGRYQPIYVATRTTYLGIAVDVTTAGAAGTLARLGIYQWDNGLPGARVLDAGTVSTATTGVKEIVISQALDPGFYFLYCVVDGAPTLRAYLAVVAVAPVSGTSATATLGLAAVAAIVTGRSADVAAGLPATAIAPTAVDDRFGMTLVLKEN